MDERFNLSPCDERLVLVQCSIEVVDEALLAHVVNDFTRGGVRRKALAPGFFNHIFEDLTEHFGVNSPFLFQRLGLIDSKVVAVEHVQHARTSDAFLDKLGVCKQLVRQLDVRLAPVVVAKWLKQSTIEERDTAL